MNISDYRSSTLSIELADLLKHPALKIAIETLDAAAPVNGGATLPSAEPHMAYVQLGVDRGYALYSNLFKALAVAPRAQAPVEATYEPVEEEAEVK